MTDALMAEEWLAAPRKRSRVRAALVVLLAAAVCFLGGALVQKHLGSTDAGASGAASGPPAMSSMQLPQGLPDLSQAGGAQGSTGASSPGGSDHVIGEVVAVRKGSWVVRDLGGKRHRIPVTDDTAVVRETKGSTDDVEVGDTVDISGDTVTLR